MYNVRSKISILAQKEDIETHSEEKKKKKPSEKGGGI